MGQILPWQCQATASPVGLPTEGSVQEAKQPHSLHTAASQGEEEGHAPALPSLSFSPGGMSPTPGLSAPHCKIGKAEAPPPHHARRMINCCAEFSSGLLVSSPWLFDGALTITENKGQSGILTRAVCLPCFLTSFCPPFLSPFLPPLPSTVGCGHHGVSQVFTSAINVENLGSQGLGRGAVALGYII